MVQKTLGLGRETFFAQDDAKNIDGSVDIVLHGGIVDLEPYK